MSFWTVTPDEDRPQWAALPHAAVGPLEFDATPETAAAALGGGPDRSGSVRWGPAAIRIDDYTTTGLRLYYADGRRLAAVAVDALAGPQVRAEGEPLTGRRPSAVARWLIGRAECREPFTELVYAPWGDPGSAGLGLVVCVQRAGDALLTRPVLLSAEWFDDAWHRLPPEEWAIR